MTRSTQLAAQMHSSSRWARTNVAPSEACARGLPGGDRVDPFTHVLAGIVVGGLCDADGIGLAVAAAGALAPDAEFLTRRIPRTAFLDYHHGIVHTLPGGLIAGLLIAVAGGLLSGREWLSLLPLALGGVASHVCLDLLMHNNGIALLAPFSRRRFSFPVVLGLNPVTASTRCRERRYGTCLQCQASGLRFNPFFWTLLTAAVACIAVPQLGRVWGILTLSILFGLILYSNRMRMAALAVTGNGEHAVRRKAFPASFGMARWLVLCEGGDEFHAALADGRARRVLWERRMPKRLPPPPVKASERLLSVRGFKNSVMFPYWTWHKVDGVDHVAWSDLSYLFAEHVELYTLHLKMDEGGQLLQNEFHERW